MHTGLVTLGNRRDCSLALCEAYGILMAIRSDGFAHLKDSPLDQLLRQAIAERRLISFTLARLERVGEPHDYGIHNGRRRLFFYQTGGRSTGDKPLGWRWADLDK